MTSSAYNPARLAGVVPGGRSHGRQHLASEEQASSPGGFAFFTKGEVGEMLSEFNEETAIWLTNYWQAENDRETPKTKTASDREPMALLASSVDTMSSPVVALKPRSR